MVLVYMPTWLGYIDGIHVTVGWYILMGCTTSYSWGWRCGDGDVYIQMMGVEMINFLQNMFLVNIHTWFTPSGNPTVCELEKPPHPTRCTPGPDVATDDGRLYRKSSESFRIIQNHSESFRIIQNHSESFSQNEVYLLVNVYAAIENHHFSWENSLFRLGNVP